jgi:hypothetical protein
VWTVVASRFVVDRARTSRVIGARMLAPVDDADGRAPDHARCDAGQETPVRMSHFWTLMDDEFGQAYAGSLARDHVLGALGDRTALQSIADGVPPRDVWEALCDDMDVPPERRLGRDDRVARGAQGGSAGR